ncbi:MAG: CAP domain-containing protein [Ilumatobacteraceae bacterium]
MRTSPLTVVAAALTAGLVAAATLTHAASGPITQAAVPGEPASRLEVPAQATEPAPSADERMARLLAEQIDAARAEHGLPPYQYDAAVAAAATAHSADQAAHDRMSHTGSDGSNAGQRLTRYGVTWQSWGENVGAGFTEPASLLQAWLDSPSHRPTVLSSTYTRVGVGVVAAADGTRYWTMDAVG